MPRARRAGRRRTRLAGGCTCRPRPPASARALASNGRRKGAAQRGRAPTVASASARPLSPMGGRRRSSRSRSGGRRRSRSSDRWRPPSRERPRRPRSGDRRRRSSRSRSRSRGRRRSPSCDRRPLSRSGDRRRRSRSHSPLPRPPSPPPSAPPPEPPAAVRVRAGDAVAAAAWSAAAAAAPARFPAPAGFLDDPATGLAHCSGYWFDPVSALFCVDATRIWLHPDDGSGVARQAAPPAAAARLAAVRPTPQQPVAASGLQLPTVAPAPRGRGAVVGAAPALDPAVLAALSAAAPVAAGPPSKNWKRKRKKRAAAAHMGAGGDPGNAGVGFGGDEPEPPPPPPPPARSIIRSTGKWGGPAPGQEAAQPPPR